MDNCATLTLGWLEVDKLLLHKGADINLWAALYAIHLIAVVSGDVEIRMTEFLLLKSPSVYA